MAQGSKKLVVKPPFSEMLAALSNVQGFEEFISHTSTRGKEEQQMNTEIKAIFEANKPQHPLLQIVSQGKNEPEAYFKVNESTKALIESRYISSSLLKQQQKCNCARNCENQFRRLTRFLPSNEATIALVIDSPTRSAPTQEDRKAVEAHLSKFEFHASRFERSFGPVVLFDRYRADDEEALFERIGQTGMIVRITRSAVYFDARMPNPTRKITDCLSEKQDARANHPRELIRVYYFLLDCPIPVFHSTNFQEIHNKLDPNEIAVVCAVADAGSGGLVEDKIVLFKEVQFNHFDVTNIHVGSYSGSRAIGRLDRCQVLITQTGEMIESRSLGLPPGMRYNLNLSKTK